MNDDDWLTAWMFFFFFCIKGWDFDFSIFCHMLFGLIDELYMARKVENKVLYFDFKSFSFQSDISMLRSDSFTVWHKLNLELMKNVVDLTNKCIRMLFWILQSFYIFYVLKKIIKECIKISKYKILKYQNIKIYFWFTLTQVHGHTYILTLS